MLIWSHSVVFQIPFSLTLRVWDLYLLEGERVMIAMAYNILRMHRRYLSKLQMDEIIEHLQVLNSYTSNAIKD